MRVSLSNKCCAHFSSLIQWIGCQIYILMKKVIILRKIQMTMKNFVPPFFKSFISESEKKKTSGNELHEKKTKHIHSSDADLLHIRIGNLDWCKWEHCKNKAREIDCLCYGEVDAMLIALGRIPEHKGSISPSTFYGKLPTISHNVLTLSSRWVFLFVPGVAERNDDAGWIHSFIFLFLVLMMWNEERRWA